MQLPRLALIINPVPIIYPIRNIRSLLNLRNPNTRAYRMNRPRRYEKRIASLNLEPPQQIRNTTPRNSIQILTFANLPVPTYIQRLRGDSYESLLLLQR